MDIYPIKCKGSHCSGIGEMGGKEPNVREIEFRLDKMRGETIRVAEMDVILYELDQISERFSFRDFKTNDLGGQQQFTVTAVLTSAAQIDGGAKIICSLGLTLVRN